MVKVLGEPGRGRRRTPGIEVQSWLEGRGAAPGGHTQEAAQLPRSPGAASFPQRGLVLPPPQAWSFCSDKPCHLPSPAEPSEGFCGHMAFIWFSLCGPRAPATMKTKQHRVRLGHLSTHLDWTAAVTRHPAQDGLSISKPVGCTRFRLGSGPGRFVPRFPSALCRLVAWGNGAATASSSSHHSIPWAPGRAESMHGHPLPASVQAGRLAA